ncbi:DUF6056 family protein [Brucella intermedia]|uniref:DUF6056 family protein n=1 Tax=Brucella intermedia TaxID=94625 RepID=UPI00124E3193|nr:DUF6056 family protein [Brucella intermedia]KAB2717978.1 hypothetical protein F9K75_05380 [Brucella intermedia]
MLSISYNLLGIISGLSCAALIALLTFSARALNRVQSSLLLPQSAIASALFLAAIFLIFLSVPLNGEDYALGTLDIGQAADERLHVFYEKAYHQWRWWNARFGEMLSIFFLSFPKWVFNLSIIPFVFAFFYFVVKIATGKGKGFWLTYSLSISVFFILWPRYEVIFWRTGAANYFIPIIGYLYIIYTVTGQGYHSLITRNPLLATLTTAIALICGMSFENLPPALVIFILLHRALDANSWTWRAILMDLVIILALLIGWWLLLSAPSTTVRTSWYREHLGYTPSVSYYLARAKDVLATYWLVSLPITISGLASTIYLVWSGGIRKHTDILILALTSILVAGSIILAPYTEARAFSFVWVICLIATIRALASLNVCAPKVIAILLAVPFIAVTFVTYQRFDASVSARDAAIRAEIGKPLCGSSFQVPLITSPAPTWMLYNREDWFSGQLHQVREFYSCNVEIQ